MLSDTLGAIFCNIETAFITKCNYKLLFYNIVVKNKLLLNYETEFSLTAVYSLR